METPQETNNTQDIIRSPEISDPPETCDAQETSGSMETTPVPEAGGTGGIKLLDHEERKELKKRSRRIIKKHYGLLVILCLIGIFIGSEFSGGALFLHIAQSETSDDPDLSVLSSTLLDDPANQVLEDLLSGNVIEGVELSDELEEKYKDSGSGIMGHTEGVLASIVGTLTSGSFYIKIIQAIFTITKSPKASLIIFVILAVLVYGLFFALIREPYRVIMRRMFLEARTYEKIPFYHLFHLKHSQRWIRASMTVILTDVFSLLWFFTIAGGFIKRYSYYLVAFIEAENPDMKPLEAITLSRRMMDGHKMECFKFELTFLPWLLLGFLTGGFLNLFFYAPYKMAAESEFYARVRADALERGVEGAEALDDNYLFEHAEEYALKQAYRDIREEQEALDEETVPLEGAKRFFAENLALWIGSLSGKEEYQRIENRRFDLSNDMNIVEGLSYPDRLDPRYRSESVRSRLKADFLRCYTLWNLALMFFLFAFIGWIWEVVLFIFQTGEFVNRGSLYGPWIPIYGVGGTMILVVVCKLRTKPLLEFFSIAVVCGIVEYFTSYFMELLTGQRWWDYSGYFLNLDGRICAEGLFAFAALGSLCVYFLAPMLDSLFMKINHKVLVTVTLGLTAIFITDVIYACFNPHTGKGITDMGDAGRTAGPPALPEEFHS